VCKDRLHDSMLAGIMRSPISFFDATPAGRILNRFSKDVDESKTMAPNNLLTDIKNANLPFFSVDVRMPFFSEFIFQAFFFCASQMIVVCVIFPFFAIPLAAILCVFFGLDIFLNEGVRQTKKLENRANSPVLHHLSSAMAGIAIIRGYQRQSLFQKR
jgi:ATP-binding cassette subfamily C (CFTR/MRP) protein 1